MPFLTKAWGWFTNNPIAQIVTAFVFALIGWEVVKRNLQETGRIKERERNQVAQAAVRVAVNERQHEIITEERGNADQAIEARDSGQHYSTFDELPDPHKRILLGRRGGEAGS